MSQIPDAISVVIPTYNRAHLIKESIQSVLDQTLQPYEIIVVDDFSTDNTEEVVNSFNSPLIKYVKNQRKKGANGARNTGILMAQGEYIAFHDSDDLWLPSKLELQKILFKGDPELTLVFCNMVKVSGNKKYLTFKKIKNKNIYQLLLENNFISTQTILIKSKIAKALMFDEDLLRLQDWDFVIRACGNAKISFLNDILVIQRINSDSITSTVKLLDAYDRIFIKYPHLKNQGLNNKTYSAIITYSKDRGGVNFFIMVFYRILRKLYYFK